MDKSLSLTIISVKETDHIEKCLQFLEELGQGTFARVFKAKNLNNNQIVAVKQIDIPLLEREEALREVQSIQKIQNDHIVTYLGSIYDLTDRSLNVMMELCRCSLRKQILQKVYSQEEITDFLVQVVSAFLELSDKKLMHLDLKPQNILISQSHEGYYKLCDFGCSQIAIKSKVSHYNGPAFGTFNYLAPEHYLLYKGRHTSSSADIWSLGIIVYEMIYKKLPFRIDVQGLIIRKQVEQYFKQQTMIEYPQSQSVNGSKKLLKVLKKMLTADPNKRPTWRELQKILKQQFKIQEHSFMNVRKIYFKHLTILKIFLTVIVICRKNIEFNPHPFWKEQQHLMNQLAQTLLHLCHIYCLKFNSIYKYKIYAKLQQTFRQKLVFIESNIQHEQKLISLRMNKKISVLSDDEFYESSLLQNAKQIKQILQKYEEQCWQAMQDLRIFCEQTIRCSQMRQSLFASGDDTYYGNTISGLNIVS